MALTFYNASVSAGASNGVVAGLFVPIADLPMVTAGEFGVGESQAKKESKALLGLGTALYDYYTANSSSIIGFSVSRSQASVSDSIINWSYGFLCSKVGRSDDGTFDVLPLPGTGTYSGIGGIHLDAVFPNAVVTTLDGAIPGEGVLIPNSMILGSSAAALAVDKRDFLEGLLMKLTATGGVSTRTTLVASAITAVSNPTAYTAFALTTAAYDATNPTTGILLADLNKIATVQKTLGYTIQLALNDSTGVFEVNSVVS